MIEIWYGDEQHFGHLGVPQRWINVLGRVDAECIRHLLPGLLLILTAIMSCNSNKEVLNVEVEMNEDADQESRLEIPIHKQTVIRFASLEEGREILGTADGWIKALSPFDRKVRMEQNEEAPQEEFLSFAASHVIEWSQGDIDAAIQPIDTVRQKLDQSGVNLNLPEHIPFIKTTGREEGGAMYTRQNAIIFPAGDLPSVGGILHELFHVMTRHAPQIREPLYGIIGYRPCSEVKLPDSLLDRKITNPDGYHNNFFIGVSVDDVPTKVMPVIYSEKDQYSGGRLFSYLTFKLMAVEISDGICQPLFDGGEPVLFDVSQVTNFHEQIGRNTGYIIHPEETMADNFAYMVTQKQDVPNPEILDSVREVLSR